MIRAIGVVLMAASLAAAFDMSAVKAEPDPEKRARAALDYANSSITTARSAYGNSEYKKALAALDEVSDAVDLCMASLDATGKSARKSPKAFKKAEMQMSEMMRRLKSVENDFGVDDRPAVERVQQRLQDAHDRLISSIMGKK